jgi:imidazolonepropionase-like amidohydrolase
VHALRAPHVFDGTRFLPGGALVLVDGAHVVGVEPVGHPLPHDCPVATYTGTLLPGLFDMHTHLVTDSGPMALDRVAGYTETEIDAVVTEALRCQLAAGVTTVRDLGDRRFTVLDRRDRQPAGKALEPRIVAAGPPITVPGGHCHYLGGEVDGAESIVAAVRERVERRVDVVKVMASGGANTPGTDVLRTQFSDDELRTVVEESHRGGLRVTAHAHGTPSVLQALAAGVDGIEHCSCVTERGFGQADDALLDDLARSGLAVCPTVGVDRSRMPVPPPPLVAVTERLGITLAELLEQRLVFVARLRGAGVRLVSGVDSGIQPGKAHGTIAFAIADLVSAGFPVDEALATSTSLAADECGLGGTTGRLEAGLEADVIAVDGDLSRDIDRLHHVALVLRAGQPLT